MSIPSTSKTPEFTSHKITSYKTSKQEESTKEKTEDNESKINEKQDVNKTKISYTDIKPHLLKLNTIKNIDSSLTAFINLVSPPLLHDIDKAINYFSTPSWNQLIDIQM